MKVLLFHAGRFGFDIESPSERLGGAKPEAVPTASLFVDECLVALFHVEEGDGDHQIRRLCKDIRRVSQKVGATRLVVAAFGHLSDSYAPVDMAMEISRQVVETCRGWEGWYEVHTSPFGYNKTMVLHAKGHPDAIKHRSYE